VTTALSGRIGPDDTVFTCVYAENIVMICRGSGELCRSSADLKKGVALQISMFHAG